jgi:exopolysaccharide production protein ExoZ
MANRVRERNLLAVPQVYRGLAALLVVLFHSAGTVQAYFGDRAALRPFGFGFTGVYFFFVLSGFIIYYIHRVDVGSPSRMLPYLQKRVIRIYPVYIAVTVALLPFWFLAPGFGEPYHRDPMALLYSLLLIPQTHPPHLSVAWTLIHEMLFYALFAVLIVSRQAGRVVLVAWFSAVIAANVLWRGELEFPYSVLLSINNLLFAIGLVAAYIVDKYPGRICYGRTLFVLGNIGFLCAGAWVVYFEPPGAIGRALITVAFGIASFAILLQAENSALNVRLRQGRLGVLLGDASYSIYLIHAPAVSLACKVVQRSGWRPAEIPLFVVVAFFAVLCGICLYFLIEIPLLRWIRSQIRRPVF